MAPWAFPSCATWKTSQFKVAPSLFGNTHSSSVEFRFAVKSLEFRQIFGASLHCHFSVHHTCIVSYLCVIPPFIPVAKCQILESASRCKISTESLLFSSDNSSRTLHYKLQPICLQPPSILQCRSPWVHPLAACGCSYRTLLLMYEAANGAAPPGLQALVRPHARPCSEFKHRWPLNSLFSTTTWLPFGSRHIHILHPVYYQ